MDRAPKGLQHSSDEAHRCALALCTCHANDRRGAACEELIRSRPHRPICLDPPRRQSRSAHDDIGITQLSKGIWACQYIHHSRRHISNAPLIGYHNLRRRPHLPRIIIRRTTLNVVPSNRNFHTVIIAYTAPKTQNIQRSDSVSYCPCSWRALIISSLISLSLVAVLLLFRLFLVYHVHWHITICNIPQQLFLRQFALTATIAIII